jgi:hypothetical protein
MFYRMDAVTAEELFGRWWWLLSVAIVLAAAFAVVPNV